MDLALPVLDAWSRVKKFYDQNFNKRRIWLPRAVELHGPRPKALPQASCLARGTSAMEGGISGKSA